MCNRPEYKEDIMSLATSWIGIAIPFLPATVDTIKHIQDIPSKIMIYKLYSILSKQKPDFDEWLKISENFEESSENYENTVRQQIMYINAINEEALFYVYANLLRSWQIGYIDKNKFLKLSWSLPQIYSEDLFFLKTICNREEYEETSELVALHNVGLVDSFIRVHDKVIYTINELGLDMLQYGVDFDNYSLYKKNRKLESCDLK